MGSNWIQKQVGIQRTPRHQQSRVCRFETLERREVLAGNVTAQVVGGDLLIKGDNADNSLVVRRIDADTFEVQGRTKDGAATKINGQANGRLRFSGVSDQLRIYTYGGDDEVNLHGTDDARLMRLPNDVIVSTGSGNDKVGMYYVHAGDDIIVNTGSGVDSFVGVTVSTGDDLFVQESKTPYYAGDSDFVNIYRNSKIGDQLNVKFNQGNDTLKTDTVSAKSFWVEGGAGNDNFNISRSSTAFDLRIDSGAGSDNIKVDRANVGDDLLVYENKGTHYSSEENNLTVTDTQVNDYLQVLGSVGTDDVRINRSSMRYLYQSLGAGDDSLNVKNTTAAHWYLNGGSGKDDLNRYNNSAFFGSRNFDYYTDYSWL